MSLSPPGLGDASGALACLLELEPLGPDMEQQLAQSAPFAAAQALLLLRMTANALLVWLTAAQTYILAALHA